MYQNENAGMNTFAYVELNMNSIDY